MRAINDAIVADQQRPEGGYNITVYHTMHDEVRCTGRTQALPKRVVHSMIGAFYAAAHSIAGFSMCRSVSMLSDAAAHYGPGLVPNILTAFGYYRTLWNMCKNVPQVCGCVRRDAKLPHARHVL
jgi:hypothetical protein